jgi:hypothetical protein
MAQIQSQSGSSQQGSKRDVWTALGVVVAALGIITTILVTSAGWRQTAADQIDLEQRRAKLQFLTDQISYLYGPLYGYMIASTDAWAEFRQQYRPRKPFWGFKPDPTPDEIKAWVLWVKSVFVPINDKMSNIILDNSHLIDGKEMPKVFVDFLTHAETIKPVVAAWDKNDFSYMVGAINYPEGLNKYICETFIRLKSKQATMLGFSDVQPAPPNCNDLGKAVPATTNAAVK